MHSSIPLAVKPWRNALDKLCESGRFQEIQPFSHLLNNALWVGSGRKSGPAANGSFPSLTFGNLPLRTRPKLDDDSDLLYEHRGRQAA